MGMGMGMVERRISAGYAGKSGGSVGDNGSSCSSDCSLPYSCEKADAPNKSTMILIMITNDDRVTPSQVVKVVKVVKVTVNVVDYDSCNSIQFNSIHASI
jgi:hypothetical protein